MNILNHPEPKHRQSEHAPHNTALPDNIFMIDMLLSSFNALYTKVFKKGENRQTGDYVKFRLKLVVTNKPPRSVFNCVRYLFMY